MNRLEKAFVASIFMGLGLFLSSLVFAGSFGTSRVAGGPSSGGIPDSSVFPAISSSTVSSAAINPFDGDGIIYGIHMTSGVAADFVILRDSDTLNTSSPVMTSVFFGTAPQQVQFNPPLRVYLGLSTNASACLAGIGTNAVGGRCYTILYDTIP